MSALQMIFRLFWIGACALTMMAQTRLLLDAPMRVGWMDGFVLGGAAFAYNFTQPALRLRAGAWVSGFLGAICLFFAFSMTHRWVLLGVPAVLWLLYYGMQRPGTAGLRGVPAAKPVVVAVVWAWVTVLLPLPLERWGDAWLVFGGRASFIFALALGYDLTDLAYDRRHGLSTLAGRLGFEKTYLLINSALAAGAMCIVANFSLKIYDWKIAAALLASLIASAWWLRFLFQKTNWRGWEKVMIDGLMVAQFALVGIGKVVGHIVG